MTTEFAQSRIEDARWMAENGAGITEAAQRLQVNADSLASPAGTGRGLSSLRRPGQQLAVTVHEPSSSIRPTQLAATSTPARVMRASPHRLQSGARKRQVTSASFSVATTTNTTTFSATGGGSKRVRLVEVRATRLVATTGAENVLGVSA